MISRLGSAIALVALTAFPLQASAVESHVIDSIGDVGFAPQVRLGLDGLPVVAYLQRVPVSNINYLKVAKCADASCTTTLAVTTVITDGLVAFDDFAIGADGRPLVLYRTAGGLKLMTCGDAACSANNTSQSVPPPPTELSDARVGIGGDGNPIVAYAYRVGASGPASVYPNYGLGLAVCSTPTCSVSTTRLLPDVDGISHAGLAISSAPDGRPAIAYAERSGSDGYGGSLRIIKCLDAKCASSAEPVHIEAGSVRIERLAMTTLSSGAPVIAYGLVPPPFPLGPMARAARVATCFDPACASGASTNLVALDSTPLEVSRGPDGLPLVLLGTASGGAGVAKCGDLACGFATTVTALGVGSSLDVSHVVGADGKPLVVFLAEASFDLAALKCTDVGCQTADAVSSPGQAGEPLAVITNIDAATISLIDTTSGAIVSLLGVGDVPEGVAIAKDGKRAYVTNLNDDTISYVNLANRVVERTVHLGPGGVVVPRGIAVLPDGSRLLVANSNQSTVSIVDVASGAIVKTLWVGGGPFGLSVNRQGTKAIVANQIAGTAAIIDIASSSVSGTVTVGAQPFGTAVSPDGGKAYVAVFGTNRVAVIDLASGLLSKTIPVGVGPFGVAASPDGKSLYVSDNANQVSVVDLALGATVASITVGLHPQGLDVTPDGRRLYVANQFANTVSVVDLATRLVERTIDVAEGPVALGAFITGPAFVEGPAIEYFHAAMGHYFMTADQDEIAALDQGYFAGWARTGQSWNVWKEGGGLKDVCRFFTVTFAPKSSHFYTANPAECALVKKNPDWQYEKIAFRVSALENGACPIGIPLYRTYNMGMTGAPNHRYTTSIAIRNEMIARGYYDEGIAGCVPE